MKETHITTQDSTVVLNIQEDDDMILVHIKIVVRDGIQYVQLVKQQIDFIQHKIFEKIDSIERNNRTFVVFENIYFEPDMRNNPKITIERPNEIEEYVDGNLPENYIEMNIKEAKLFLQKLGKSI